MRGRAQEHPDPNAAMAAVRGDGARGRPPWGRKKKKKAKELELDEHRLEQRIKQIAYGENTRGYQNFMKALERCGMQGKSILWNPRVMMYYRQAFKPFTIWKGDAILRIFLV